MKMDNKGLSLVELLIVIAIMSVLTGVMAIGVTLALSKPADECAEKMVSTLNNARITTMGKQEITMRFYADSDGIKMQEVIKAKAADGSLTTISDKTSKIGQAGVLVEYRLNGESDYPHTLDSTGITLSFKRSTGGFNTVNGTNYCEAIRVSKGTREKFITLAYLTGKVTIND